MRVDFTPEEEAQVAHLAANAGTDAEHWVKDTILRILKAQVRPEATPAELPVWRLGALGSLHRQDISMMFIDPGIVDTNVLVYAMDASAPQHADSRPVARSGCAT